MLLTASLKDQECCGLTYPGLSQVSGVDSSSDFLLSLKMVPGISWQQEECLVQRSILVTFLMLMGRGPNSSFILLLKEQESYQLPWLNWDPEKAKGEAGQAAIMFCAGKARPLEVLSIKQQTSKSVQ